MSGHFIALVSKLPAAMNSLSPPQVAFYEALPYWVHPLALLGSLAGLAGSLGLLLRQYWAWIVLGVGCAATVGSTGYMIVFTRLLNDLGADETVFLVFSLFVLVTLLVEAVRRRPRQE